MCVPPSYSLTLSSPVTGRADKAYCSHSSVPLAILVQKLSADKTAILTARLGHATKVRYHRFPRSDGGTNGLMAIPINTGFVVVRYEHRPNRCYHHVFCCSSPCTLLFITMSTDITMYTAVYHHVYCCLSPRILISPCTLLFITCILISPCTLLFITMDTDITMYTAVYHHVY